MASNRIRARQSFHRIWIAGKKSLVKRAPCLKLSCSVTITRARLRHVTPLGRPRSVYESDVEFLEVKWPKDLEGEGQWPPFSITAEKIPGCIFGANLVTLSQSHNMLLHGQAEFPIIVSQNGQNDLEGHGQWPPFSISTKSVPWCMFGANLAIPAQICDELSCGQEKVYGQTDGQTQATTIPFRPERLRGKNYGHG